MTTSRYKRCQFHYAPLAGFLAVTRNGENVTPANMSEWAEMMSEFLELRKAGHLVLMETMQYGHFLFSGHRGGVHIYAWESVWTVPKASFPLGGVREIEANELALAAATVGVSNKQKTGRLYRVTVTGKEMRRLVVFVRARSANRAMQFAWTYTKCRWLNTKQDRQRDTRRVWVETCALYTNS